MQVQCGQAPCLPGPLLFSQGLEQCRFTPCSLYIYWKECMASINIHNLAIMICLIFMKSFHMPLEKIYYAQIEFLWKSETKKSLYL